MYVNGKHYRSVWANKKEKEILLIDQRHLPFLFEIRHIHKVEELIEAIQTLAVRGAPAIGIAAAYGVWLILEQFKNNPDQMEEAYNKLIHCRPTAINLMRGAEFVWHRVSEDLNPDRAFDLAEQYANQEIDASRLIGENGVILIEQFYTMVQRTVNILTHCNAGWLACGDYGTALSPIFEANRRGIPVHVFVDETQPLLQGARLTAWELLHEKIPFTIIPDNNAGYLMALEKVDMVITGADRITRIGDVANKIGTYSLAVLAHHHEIPFYVAAPSSTFDFNLQSGHDISIEQRSKIEVLHAKVWYEDKLKNLPKTLPDFPALNYAFDVTPAQYVHAYVTERGIIKSPEQLKI